MRHLAPSRWKRSCEWAGEGGDAGVRDRSRVAVGNGRQMGIEAHLAVGRDPLDAAIGGDALLKAAVHQLGVVALPFHLRWGERWELPAEYLASLRQVRVQRARGR